jgi:DNA repair photolyase
MPLNPSKGNMYPFVTHTWNPIRGKCPHDCSYCYMKNDRADSGIGEVHEGHPEGQFEEDITIETSAVLLPCAVSSLLI